MRRLVNILAWLVSAVVAMAQSAQCNYVVSRTYLDGNASQCIEQIAYFDGLGRLSETVSRGITPSGADLITLTEYEGLSRDVRTWLPVPYSANGAFVSPSSVMSAVQSRHNRSPEFCVSGAEAPCS